MKEESSADRLLEASGVKKASTPLEELLEVRNQINNSVGKLLTKSDQALLAAQESQQATEEMFLRLQKYCNEKVPAQMVKVLETVAQEEFQKCLDPLRAGVAQAVQDIVSCRQSLSFMSWNWRLMLGAGSTMFAVLLVAGGLIYYLFFSVRIAEMKRLSAWGHTLETRYQASSPKEREKLDQWFRGGKL
jgi:hypothetical protein